jgi:hypothetical protein
MEDAEKLARDYQVQLEEVYASVANYEEEHDPNFQPPAVPNAEDVPTFISEPLIREIAATQIAIPEGFHVHPKLLPQLQKRAESIDNGTIDWSTGEMLAFGSLLKEGRPIRLAGQDSRRGTFSNRHAVIVDKENGSDLTPLSSLVADMQRWDLSMDIRLLDLKHLSYGKANSEISQMGLKQLLMNLSLLHFKSGASVHRWSCYFHMVMKVKDQITLQHVLNVSSHLPLKRI